MSERDLWPIFSALSEQQRDVLGEIAFDQDLGHHPFTTKALAKRGLIEEYEQTLPGRFPVVVMRYRMPLPIHIQWCAWCADHFTEEGEYVAAGGLDA